MKLLLFSHLHSSHTRSLVMLVSILLVGACQLASPAPPPFRAAIQVSTTTVRVGETLVVTGTLFDATPAPHVVTFGARKSFLCIRTGSPATPLPSPPNPNLNYCVQSIGEVTSEPPPPDPIFAPIPVAQTETMDGRNTIEVYHLRALRPGIIVLNYAVNGEIVDGRELWFTTYDATSPHITVVGAP